MKAFWIVRKLLYEKRNGNQLISKFQTLVFNPLTSAKLFNMVDSTWFEGASGAMN